MNTFHEKAMLPKICRYCKELKQPEELMTRGVFKNTTIIRRTTECKKCKNKRRELARKTNGPTEARKESNKRRINNYNRSEKGKNYKMLSEYGVGLDWYKNTLELQNYKCPICDITLTDKNHIDHCHLTGKVRAILCRNCNIGLGQFNDNIDKLKSAIEYLNSHK